MRAGAWLADLDFEGDYARSLEKRRQLENAGRTTITGCNGRVHGWRVVEDYGGVKLCRLDGVAGLLVPSETALTDRGTSFPRESACFRTQIRTKTLYLSRYELGG